MSTQDVYAGAGSTAGYGTVYDDEPQVSISTAYLSGSTFTFTVSLIGAHDEIVNIDFTTMNGTAIAGVDYAANIGTLTFGVNEYSKEIVVDVIDATITDKYFSIDISGTTYVNITTSTAYGYWYYDSGYYGGGDYYYWDYYYYGWY